MEDTGSLVYSKAVWTVISGTHLRATRDVVEKELNRAAVLICNGLIAYRPPSDAAQKKFKGKVGENVYKFVNELSAFLATEFMQTWDLLSNYLIYEFQGSEVGLNAFLGNERKKSMLMNDIWLFYHSERLFLLKCINLIVAYCTDKDHPYQETLAKFMSRFDEEEFGDLLVRQLETVTNEPYPHKDIRGLMMSDIFQLQWQNYNLREQIEVLHNIILHLEMHAMSPERMKKIVKICIDSRFGKQEEYKLRNTILAAHYSQTIGYLQSILILHYTNYANHCVLEGRPCPIDLEELVNGLGNQEEHSLLMLSWTLMKVFQCKCKPSSEMIEKLGYLTVNSNAFKYLQKLILCDVFQDNVKLSNFVFKTAYDFVNLFASNFETKALGGIPDLLDLVGPVLKHEGNVDIFWTNDNGIKSLFEILIERFPAEYLPFMKAVHSLTLYAGKHLPKIMTVLYNTGCFAECMCESLRKSSILTYSEWKISIAHRPMVWSHFILEPGTKGYWVKDEPPMVSWKCGFSVFEAISDQLADLQYKMDFVNGDHIEENVLKNAQVALELLRDVLSTGLDPKFIIKKTFNSIFMITSKLKTAKCYPTSIFALCLEVIIVLLPKLPDSLLRRLRLLDILPAVNSIPTDIRQIFDGEYFMPKTLALIVGRDECCVGKYPLLRTFLTFIYKMIKGGEDICPGDYFMTVVFPGVVFILSDVYPNYHSWTYIEESEHDMIAITCIKIFHELLHVGYLSQKNPRRSTHMCIMQKLVLYALLNMKAGKVLLTTVSSGVNFLQSKMEKKLNWVTGETNFTNLLQLSLSILNRVLLLKSMVQEKTVLSALENEIYCSPKENFKIIPTVATYVNSNFSNVLPVLAVKVLRRFALDLPKTLLACLGIEGDVLREMIFRRLNSKTDSNRLKVALLQLVSACVDTQPGMCDAFFNLPQEPLDANDNGRSDADEGASAKSELPDFLKKIPCRNNTKGGVLVYVCAVLAMVDKEPEVVTTPLYAAAIEVICSLWVGDNFAAIEFLRIKEDFWNKFCVLLFKQPKEYTYAHSQIFNILTLEVFHYGKDCHPDLLKILEKFIDEKHLYFAHWAQFVCEMCVSPKISVESQDYSLQLYEKQSDVPWDRVMLLEETDEKSFLSSRKMEKQPPNIQLLISWKRFLITTMKLLPFKLNANQKTFLTVSILEALGHEVPKMTLKPILLLIELYIILVSDWHKQFFDDQEDVKNQLQLMLKSFAGSYVQLPCRLREAILAFGLQAVDCLSEQIQRDAVAAETMLQASTDIVLLELSDIGVPECMVKLSKDEGDDEDSDIFPSLIHLLAPGMCLQNEPLHPKGSLSGKLSLLLLHKLLKILIKRVAWLKEHDIAIIRNGILISLGKILNGIHADFPPLNMLQFSVARSAMNLLYFMIDNKIMDNALDYQLPLNLWSQLLPPKDKEKHWLCTCWPQIYKPALEMITRHFEARAYFFLDDVISFVSMHDTYIVDSLLAFRLSLNEEMLELSMITLNLVRKLSCYPNHWRLANDSSLNFIMFGVMTCVHMCVALLIHPTMLRFLIERGQEKKVQKCTTEAEPNEMVVTIYNKLLKLVFGCLSSLQMFCPRLSYLLTECVSTPVTSKPLLEPNLDAPMYDDDSSVALSFGTLITLAHLCTQSLSKIVRIPSPRPSMTSFRGLGVGTSLLLTMDKNLTGAVLEMTVEMITSQGLVYLLGKSLSPSHKELFRRSLNTEMTFFIEFSKRSFKEEISSVTLESILHAIKNYLTVTLNLPMLKSVQSEKSQIPAKSRKLQGREVSRSTPPKTSKPSNLYRALLIPSSPSSSTSPPSLSGQSSSETSPAGLTCSEPTPGPSSTKPHSPDPCPPETSSSGPCPPETTSPEGSSTCPCDNKEKPPEISDEFQLPLNEGFVNLVAFIFSSVFDIFA